MSGIYVCTNMFILQCLVHKPLGRRSDLRRSQGVVAPFSVVSVQYIGDEQHAGDAGQDGGNDRQPKGVGDDVGVGDVRYPADHSNKTENSCKQKK